MPAVMKKNATLAKSGLEKQPKSLKAKAPKAKMISQLGVTPVKTTKSKHPYNPVKARRGIIFIKHIPHGFYEEQLKSYFEQFGSVTRTRVARSERSGKSKGYAFVEFRVPEVAKIAAETMDNYLMFKQVLKTAYIAPEDQKYNYFRQPVRSVSEPDGTERLVTPKTMRVAKAVKKMNTMPTKRQHDNRVERALYKLKKSQEAFAAKSIDIDLEHTVHGRATVDDPTAASAPKKLTKKQQKAAAEAKRVAKLARKANTSAATTTDDDAVAADDDETASPPAAKKAKKAAAGANTTLDKLLNETIGESADEDSNDEDFDGSAAEMDVSMNASTSSASSAVSSASSASSSSAVQSPSPVKVKSKRAAAAVVLAAKKKPSTITTTEESDATVSSPEPIVRTKKPSALLAAGGVQKKRVAQKQQVPVIKKATKAVQKVSKATAKQLILSTVSTVQKVKSGELKKKPKKA